MKTILGNNGRKFSVELLTQSSIYTCDLCPTSLPLKAIGIIRYTFISQNSPSIFDVVAENIEIAFCVECKKEIAKIFSQELT